MFLHDLRVGRGGEKIVRKLFESAGFHCVGHKGPGWDLSAALGDETVRAEAKVDRKYAVTGNLAIEYHNPRAKKPSGLSVTRADCWFAVLPAQGLTQVWVAPVHLLKTFFRHCTDCREIIGGDKNASLRIYPAGLLLGSVFTRADTLHPAAFVKLVLNCR